MNLSTIVFGVIVLFFLWNGYQKGFIGSITRIVSWIVAYPAAIFLTKPVAKIIVAHTSLDGLLVYFIAGGAVFLIVSIIVTQLLKALSRSIPDDSMTENVSKAGGAIIGIFVGGFVGLLVGYAMNLAQGPVNTASRDVPSAIAVPVNQSGTSQSGYAQPVAGVDNAANKQFADVQSYSKSAVVYDSFITSAAKKVVSKVASTAIDLALQDDTATQLTKAFTEDPQAMLGHMKQLSKDGHITALLADENIQNLLSSGDINALLEDEQFQKLMANEDMQAILSGSGDDANNTQQKAAETMVKAWQRTDAIKNDPRVLEIMADPDFQKQVMADNKLPLFMNPKLKELTEIIFSNDSATVDTAVTNQDIGNSDAEVAAGADEPVVKSKKVAAAKPDREVFKWTDENGVVHFSDTPVNQ